MPLFRFAFVLPLALSSLAACGDTPSESSGGGGSTSTSSGGSGGSGGGGEGRVPKQHRAAATACPEERPAGQIDGGSDGVCMTDAECTEGDNGRCVQDLGKPTFCSYDACASDGDCGATSVCECRNPASHEANTCQSGNCRVDADCGSGGYCSPSAVTLSPFCTEGVPVGSVGYFCHTPEDECLDDDDCMIGSFGSCFFNVDKLHFACFELMCVN